MSEQRAIAAVLGALDDKIEQNRRTARALERLARAVFRAWFVDFEPVKAKAAGAVSFPSMPQELFRSLPTRLVDSALGSIPEGWAVRRMSEICAVNPPRALHKGDQAPYLDMKSMPTNGHIPERPVKRAFTSGAKFTNGDTLVARITPCFENGKTALIDLLGKDEIGWGSTEYIVLRPHSPVPPQFAYLLARTKEFRDFAEKSMAGTSGRQRIPYTAFDHFRCVAAPEMVMASFGELTGPVFKCSASLDEKSSKLASIRDLLLPGLLSGKIAAPPSGDL